MVFEIKCANVGARIPRPIASITRPGGENGAPYVGLRERI